MHARYGALAGLLLGLAAVGTAGQTADSKKITYREVSYEELGQIVRGLKGKVVVVDFWAEY